MYDRFEMTRLIGKLEEAIDELNTLASQCQVEAAIPESVGAIMELVSAINMYDNGKHQACVKSLQIEHSIAQARSRLDIARGLSAMDGWKQEVRVFQKFLKDLDLVGQKDKRIIQELTTDGKWLSGFKESR